MQKPTEARTEVRGKDAQNNLASPYPPIRFATTSAVTPRTLTVLCRDVLPRTSSTQFRGQSKTSARNRTNASFAAESTGGAITFTRNSFPNTSPISFAEARG